nr:MAG TPA: tyrosine phosphatase family protein [Caudoviricetes sp.]
MANKLYNDTSIKAIADAIRAKNGKTDTYTVGEMSVAINDISAGGGIEPQDKTYSQVNPVVAEYLANANYSADDYTTTQIDSYLSEETSYNKSKPSGAEITTGEGELILEDKYSGLAVRKNVTAGSQMITNVTPGKGGSYVVVKNGTVINCGNLNPTGALRMIDCKAPNVRDLGGWACDGGTISYGKLFRGGDLYEGYKGELREVLCDQLGIRAELNLRGANEVTATSSVLGDDIIYCRPEQIVWYSIKDKTTWKEILRFVFDRIKDNQPVYYHCSAGADRTGTLSCVLEAILGVDSSDRDKDYELTSFTGEGYIRKRTYASGNNAAGADWVGLINAINALTVRTTFRDKVINWVASMGFTVDEINAFRTAMIDGTPETITLDIGTCSVTSNLSNSLSDNSETSLAKYQPYSAVIVPKGGNVIKSIIVTMGGVDVTGKYVKKIFEPNGEINIDVEGKYNVSEYSVAKVEFPNYSITQTLGEATNNNAADAVTKNKGYGAIIKSNNGFKIKNIIVTMGGIDVTGNVTVGMEV